MRHENGTTTRRLPGATGLTFVLLAPLIGAACGSPPPPKTPAPTAPAVVAEVHERVVPHTCGARAKIAEMFGHSAPAPAPAPDEAPDTAPPPLSTAGSSALGGNQAYRLVAPATVLIRTPAGFGTGVVVDPKGYVLTNHHVIESGEQKDFIVTVEVQLGELTPTGRMTRIDKTYEGTVVKDDPVRDIALVRLKDPPANLTSVKLAKSAPQIGEKVMSIGNAGIGFLWAAKSCSVASVGERQQDTSVLAGFDCTETDPSMTADAAERQRKQCEDMKKQVTDAFTGTAQGLAIQTDCAVTHGDSGGPLVNVAGELVGLNQSIAADMATASFHVHVDELRDFTTKYGEEGVAIVPDPLCEGGLNPHLEDLDLDGTPDTVVSQTPMTIQALLTGQKPKSGFLIDLDQDHFSKPHAELDPFDAEIALINEGQRALVFYDTDNDGHFDLLLVDSKNRGKPDAAYRLDNDGHITKDTGSLPEHDLDVSLVKKTELSARLGKIATAIGGAGYVSPTALAAAAKASALPDPLAVGTQGRFVDSDANGKSDALFARGSYSRGFLLDPDEKTASAFKPNDSAEDALKAKSVAPEVSILFQGTNAWAYYDTNDDGKFDLVLATQAASSSGGLFATSAFRLTPGGDMTPAPDQLGRNVLRAAIVTAPRVRTELRLTGYDIAQDEAGGSLPDARPPKGHYMFHEVKGFPRATVIEAIGGTNFARGTLIDLDASAQVPETADPEKVANDPKVHAEMAVLRRAEGAWYYYDTDGDHKFDLVLFVPLGAETPTAAYRLKVDKADKTAMTLEADPSAVSGKPIRCKSAWKNKALGAKCEAVASKLFSASAGE
jgi:S1-C subfamily serine protease